MATLQEASPDHRPGDKVRIRTGTERGTRGVVHTVRQGTLEVELASGKTLTVHPDEVTNYSRAARRAWAAMPKRAGRPRSTQEPKRMVSLRLESDLWRLLGAAVDLGLIRSREQAVNDWLRQRLSELFANAASGNPPGAESVQAPIALSTYQAARRQQAR